MILRIFTSVAFVFILIVSGHSAVPEYEQPRSVPAESAIPANAVKGTNYTVKSPVTNDGYTNIYTIDSPYGSFTAYGNSMLFVRLQEIEAIAQLKEISTSEAVAKAAAKQAVKPVEAAKKMVEDPIETAKNIPGGIKRKFENVGRFVKNRREEEPVDPNAAEQETESAAGEVAKNVLGVTAAHRKWAQKVGADPYSTNPVLQAELDRLARVDSIASLGVKAAQRKVPGLRPITRVYDLAWGMDPQALQKMNEKRLKEMGVTESLSRSFLQNRALTLTQQTLIVSALYELPKTNGRTEFIRSALSAESERDAYLYMDSASIISQMMKQGAPISRFVPNPHIIVLNSGNNFAAVLPADELYWTKSFAAAMSQFEKRHAADLKKSSNKAVWLSGKASSGFASQMKARGWQIRSEIQKDDSTQ